MVGKWLGVASKKALTSGLARADAARLPEWDPLFSKATMGDST